MKNTLQITYRKTPETASSTKKYTQIIKANSVFKKGEAVTEPRTVIEHPNKKIKHSIEEYKINETFRTKSKESALVILSKRNKEAIKLANFYDSQGNIVTLLESKEEN